MSRIVIARVDLNQILFGAAFSLPSQLGRCKKKTRRKAKYFGRNILWLFKCQNKSEKNLSHLAGKLSLGKERSGFEPKNVLSLLAGKTLRF